MKKFWSFFVIVVMMSVFVAAPAGPGSCSDNLDIISCLTDMANPFCGWDQSNNGCIECSGWIGTSEAACESIYGCSWRSYDSFCLTCGFTNLDLTECNENKDCGWGDPYATCDKCYNLGETDCNNADNCDWVGGACTTKPKVTQVLFPTGYGSTDFSAILDFSSVPSLKLATQYGSVQWSGNVDMTYQDIDSNIIVGDGFVSIDVDNLDSSFDSTAIVEVSVDSCASWTIYHSDEPVSSLAELKSVGTQVGSGSGATGSCTTYCSNPSCVGNVLSYTVTGFDGTGGEGGGEEQGIPEVFSGEIMKIVGFLAFALVSTLIVIRSRK